MFPVPGNYGTPKTSKKIEEWTNSFLRHSHTAHKILTGLYQDINTGEDVSLREPTGLTAIGSMDYGGEPAPDLARLFIQTCQKLVDSLNSKLDVPVKVPLGITMRLIQRCLSLHFKDIMSLPSLRELANVTPSIQQTALELLICLIWCFKSTILPQSKIIVDLLQQVLKSTESMELKQKSTLRGCVYQVHCVWLQTVGRGARGPWGALLPCIVGDLGALGDLGGLAAPATPQVNGSSTPQHNSQPKGHKHKHRQRGAAYAGLQQEGPPSEPTGPPHQAHLASMALAVTTALLERGQFVQMQKLSDSLTDLAGSLQRQAAPPTSPFCLAHCRVALYKAVWRTANLSLDIGVGTAETVAHFELTNKSLGLIAHAAHQDSAAEVRSFCQEKLCAMQSYKNLQRPIVRKVLPDDQEKAADLSEASMKVERLTEENDRLRKRLLEVELELQKKDVVTQEILQRAAKEAIDLQSSAKVAKHISDDSDEDSSNDDDDLSLLSHDDDHKQNDTFKESDGGDKEISKEEEEKILSQKRKTAEEHENKSNKKKQKVSSEKQIDIKAKNTDGSKKNNTDENAIYATSPVSASTQAPLTQKKDNAEIEEKQSDNLIQEMLLDFVDAEPDK